MSDKVNKKRKILAITGRRAEYGFSTSIFKAIENHPRLKLYLVVTGIHLCKEVGETINEIKKDGFRIYSIIEAYPKDDTRAAMCQAFGKDVIKLTEAVRNLRPDIILVLADLDYALAGAIIGSHMDIPVAHLHGGDLSGSIDDSIRHAVTKFAHIHFPVTKESAARIIKMGEEPWRVNVVGAPQLDDIKKKRLIKPRSIAKELNIDLKSSVILLIQHPVTTEIEYISEQIRETMGAISELKLQTVIIYPNLDAGGRRIIGEIEKYRKKKYIRIFNNLSRIEYLSLMNIADVMVGNSSSGIIESSSFKLPVVNIGTRQEARQRAKNVIDVTYNKEEIKKAIKTAMGKDFRKSVRKIKSPYGNGKAGKKIARLLAEIKIDRKLLQKRMTY